MPNGLNYCITFTIYRCDCGLQVGKQWFNLFTLFYECFMLGLGVYEFTGYVILNSLYL